MNLRLLALLTAAAAAAATTTLAMHANDASAEDAPTTYTATLVSAAPPGSVWAAQLDALKARIAQETNNRVQVTIVLGGNETALVNQVKSGTVQAGAFSAQAVAHTAGVPRLQVAELPYLFQSTAEVDHVLDSVVRAPITADLDAQGLVFGMWSDNGWLNFVDKTTLFNTPGELAAKTLRRQPGWLHQKLFAALNTTNTVPLEVSQIKPKLQSDTISGLEASLQYLAAANLPSVQKVTESKHIFQPALVVWSDGFWDTLPPDLKPKVQAAQDGLVASSRGAIRAQEAAARSQLLGQGVTIQAPADAAAFKAQTQVVYTQFSSLSPGAAQLLQDVQNALTTLRGQ